MIRAEPWNEQTASDLFKVGYQSMYKHYPDTVSKKCAGVTKVMHVTGVPKRIVDRLKRIWDEQTVGIPQAAAETIQDAVGEGIFHVNCKAINTLSSKVRAASIALQHLSDALEELSDAILDVEDS